MYLTISKRLEFSASYRYQVRKWSEENNRAFFGPEGGGSHGIGSNFTAYFVFGGSPDAKSGMLINVADIKQRAGHLLAQRYDHKFLNEDTPPFDEMVPTPENIARQLLSDAAPLFANRPAQLAVCHLTMTPTREASAYAGGIVEQEHRLEFSSARQTFSPHLSQEENRRLFGAAAAPSGHGHRYALRLVLQGTVDPEHGFIVPERDCDPVLAELHRKLDHRFLNADVAELRGMPMTTECLARFIWRWLAGKLPVARIVLWENPDFFVEYGPDGMARMGITGSFHAAHRLHSPHLSDAENLTMYGICNNPRGHGHLYRVEAAIDGTIDDRTGTVFPLDRIQSGLDTALASWCFKHLDLDTSDFADKPSTSENMIHVLWPRIEKALGRPLCRLRLWETPNNRFTLRRSASTGGT